MGAISDRLPISRPAVSRHLLLLEAAGLVRHTPLGASNVFRLQAEGFDQARVYLEQFWDNALANFKEAVENDAAEE